MVCVAALTGSSAASNVIVAGSIGAVCVTSPGGAQYNQRPSRRKQVLQVAIADVGTGTGRDVEVDGVPDEEFGGMAYCMSELPCQPRRANASAVRLTLLLACARSVTSTAVG